MNSLFDGFDANEVEPSVGFEELPAGNYVAIVASSEEKETASKTGRYLGLKFQIVEGQYANRVLFANLNLVNPNPKAVQIARAELSALCRAIGTPVIRDSSELHGKPLVLKVGFEKDKQTGEMKNAIKGYEKYTVGDAVQSLVNQSVGQPANHIPPVSPAQNSWMGGGANPNAVPF